MEAQILSSFPEVLQQLELTAGVEIYGVDHFVRNGDEYLVVKQTSEWEGGMSLFKSRGGRFEHVWSDTYFDIAEADQVVSLDYMYRGTCKKSSDADHETIAKAEVDEVDKFSSASGPDGGNLACVWAVRHLVKKHLGRWVTKTDGTAVFYPELKICMGSSHAQSDVKAGGIIISPTEGSTIGHVGLLGPVVKESNKRLIYSNSSKYAVWKQNFTLEEWRARYVGTKKLGLYFYPLPHKS